MAPTETTPWWQRDWRSDPPEDLALTLVVPVYNERFLATILLGRLFELNLPHVSRLEILVVDDGSTDGTRELLVDFARDQQRAHAADPATRRTRARAPRFGPGSKRRPATSSSSRTPTSSTTRAIWRRLIEPFVEDGADVVYGSRFLAGERRAGTLLPARARQPLHHVSQQLVHRPEPDRRRDLLQDVPRTAAASPCRCARTISRSRSSSPPRSPKRRWSLYEVPISYHGRTYREGKKIGVKDGVSSADLRSSSSGSSTISTRRTRTAATFSTTSSERSASTAGWRTRSPLDRQPGARDRRRHRQHHQLSDSARPLRG